MDFDLSGFQIAHMKPFSILRERRVILGLTQKQVAERAGVVLQQYQKFESGERRIMTSSFELACRIRLWTWILQSSFTGNILLARKSMILLKDLVIRKLANLQPKTSSDSLFNKSLKFGNTKF